jgi:peroxiredoxin
MSKHPKKPPINTAKPILSIVSSLGGLIVTGLLGLVLLRAVFPATYFDLKNIVLQSSYRFKGLGVGSEAPDFTAPTLEGETYTLSQFRGQPVIISFGASWCPDCRQQAPMLNAVHAKYPNLIILEINRNESEAEIRQFIADFQMGYPTLTDPGGAIYQSYQNFGIPSTFFIDSDGIIRARMVSTVTQERMNAGLEAIGIKK